MILTYKKNIIFIFLKNIFNVSFFFLSLVLILNVLEEITFFKKIDVSVFLPIYLTLLNSTSILFQIFPFIFLIGTMSFFIEILDKNELIIYKSYGLSNLKIIGVILSTTLILGAFLVLFFYNISSSLKFLYLEIKSDYTTDDKYLAVITDNGLWIKDQIDGNINIINAEKIKNENLTNVLISQFDTDYNLIRFIDAKKVNIKNMVWLVDDAKINKNNSVIKSPKTILFKTNFNYERISTLFSNLTSLNLIKLNKLKRNYVDLGYSTTEVDNHLLNLYMYPIYLSIMISIASILMLNIGYNKPRIFYIITGILISVLVYYMNYLFNLLIENQKIPSMFSVWFPQFLLFLFCLFGLVRINEK